MTELLEKAVAAARTLRPAAQDEIARTMLLLAEEETTPVRLTPDERMALAASKAAATRGEFATDEEVQAVWRKHGV